MPEIETDGIEAVGIEADGIEADGIEAVGIEMAGIERTAITTTAYAPGTHVAAVVAVLCRRAGLWWAGVIGGFREVAF